VKMDDIELERAIFELPLEEPPAGLRSSILLATAYRPAPVFSIWDLAGIGAAGAVAIWLVALLVLGGGSLFVHTLESIGSFASRFFTNATTLAWLAAGGATAIWLSLFAGSQSFGLLSYRSERRTGR
jgi:hypothetical protein